ncbi:DUF3710 domain-containing protein [Streptomyces montanisoli]|uniref:DUF3710 domain-containing protein n=1 Tax=Streptomyces montanisoli TaxID=2798581 RepID=A0A940MK98_9ACTN|nr:DUF3710 domain-containing protein [Streptomyces montanisoli]
MRNEPVAVRFVGCGGPEWMLRGVVTGPGADSDILQVQSRQIFLRTVVDVRGVHATTQPPHHVAVAASGRMERSRHSTVRLTLQLEPLAVTPLRRRPLLGRRADATSRRGSGAARSPAGQS